MDGKGGGTEAQRFVWEGAIPLQIHLHDSEVTTLPPPAPALILAPRLGYLPLLVPVIKPFFSSSLPPGVDTIWFEYKGLPLKWYIPTGVLFDLLCAEPQRPWNLTVHFRGYPGNVLTPCEGEDSVKWSFINSLKEAAYIINGNCKNIMNMSQSDQTELWQSVQKGQVEIYLRVSSKLKLDIIGDDFSVKLNSAASKSQSTNDLEGAAATRTGRIPVRLYVRSIDNDVDDLEDAPNVDSWEKVHYINRPVEIDSEGKCLTLNDAVRALLPELFKDETSIDANDMYGTEENVLESEESGRSKSPEKTGGTFIGLSHKAEIKLVRVQGIEPKLEIPFGWLVNNLMNPDHYLHICVYVRVLEPITI